MLTKRRQTLNFSQVDPRIKKGQPCGNSHISSRYRCKKGVSVFPSHVLKSFTHDEINKLGQEQVFKEYQRRHKALSNIAEKLENGRFAYSVKDLFSKNPITNRSANGKERAISAIRDAIDPRVGLLGTKDKDGNPIGFLSYKEGNGTISIQHIGTDQTEKGTGALLFSQLVLLAAKKGKSINVASEEEATPFYEKMGMKGETGGHYMDAKSVREFAQKYLSQD